MRPFKRIREGRFHVEAFGFDVDAITLNTLIKGLLDTAQVEPCPERRIAIRELAGIGQREIKADQTLQYARAS